MKKVMTNIVKNYGCKKSLPTKLLTIIIPLLFQVTERAYLITSDNIVYKCSSSSSFPIHMRIQNLVQL